MTHHLEFAHLVGLSANRKSSEMEAWLDMRTIRIPRPKLVVSTITAATTVSVASMSAVTVRSDAAIAHRSLENLSLEDSSPANHRSLPNGSTGLTEAQAEGRN